MQLSYLGVTATIPAGLGYMWVAGDHFIWLSPLDWVYISASITIGLFAYYAIVTAMRAGDVSFVSPFRYARLLFALVIGIVVFSENPDTLTLLGAAIIVASGSYTFWRERKLGIAT
jgi:drug/metabolite transporter (DMT)-like permease